MKAGRSGITRSEQFAEVADALNLKKFPYVGGAAPRTNVVRDVVFTTNESPPSEPIPFHHEMAQCPTPPKYVMFYCETPSASGGETPIILSNEVAEYMKLKHPKFTEKVLAHGVQYNRVMPFEDDNSSAIGRSWKSTFLCNTKEEAEARTKAFMQCTEAWEILGDPKKRRQYDMSAGEGSGAVAARRGKKHDLVMDPVSVEETGILGR